MTSSSVLSVLMHDAIVECFRPDKKRAANFLDGLKNENVQY